MTKVEPEDENENSEEITQEEALKLVMIQKIAMLLDY